MLFLLKEPRRNPNVDYGKLSADDVTAQLEWDALAHLMRLEGPFLVCSFVLLILYAYSYAYGYASICVYKF